MKWRVLKVLGILTILAQLSVEAVRADDDAVFDQDIAKLGAAMKSSDFPTIIDMMYTPIVNAGGGRDKLVAQSRSMTSSVTFISLDPIKPYRQISGTKNDYEVIPTRAILEVRGNRYQSSSFELAVRPHGASAWQYVDGAGITPQFRTLFFSDLPADATLPEHSTKLIDSSAPSPDAK
jgi:hypothetical protein